MTLLHVHFYEPLNIPVSIPSNLLFMAPAGMSRDVPDKRVPLAGGCPARQSIPVCLRTCDTPRAQPAPRLAATMLDESQA